MLIVNASPPDTAPDTEFPPLPPPPPIDAAIIPGESEPKVVISTP